MRWGTQKKKALSLLAARKCRHEAPRGRGWECGGVRVPAVSSILGGSGRALDYRSEGTRTLALLSLQVPGGGVQTIVGTAPSE